MQNIQLLVVYAINQRVPALVGGFVNEQTHDFVCWDEFYILLKISYEIWVVIPSNHAEVLEVLDTNLCEEALHLGQITLLY